MRQEIRQGLLARRDGLFGGDISEGFSDMGRRAFAVIQYESEGLADVLDYLIVEDRESAIESMQVWAKGYDVSTFRSWALDLMQELDDVMNSHWRKRVTPDDRKKLTQWFADARKLIDDVDRL